MVYAANFQDHQALAEEQDEAISLRDFPLSTDENDDAIKDLSQYNHDSPSSPSNFFEFISDLSSEMSHAEEIIFCGKLLPYKLQPVPDDIHNHNGHNHPIHDDQRSRGINQRPLSQSLDELKMKRLSSSTNKVSLRSSRSLGFRSSKTVRWYFFLSGIGKFPPEMDIRDIKNRQVQRNTGSSFLLTGPRREALASRSDRRSSWGYDLLKVLSCKNHANVAIQPSIR